MKKKRIDELFVEKGLAINIDEARRFIMAGLAIADDKRVDKAGDLVCSDAVIRLKNRLPYVSRGGLKLKHAVDMFKLNMHNAFVMDIGSSTGGFTDVCIQEGALNVVAIDSGTAQLHNKLIHNEKVIPFEHTNFKYFEFNKINRYCDYIVTDVSFISLCAIIPNMVNFCRNGTILIALIKPQFEAEYNEVEKGGIVRDKSIHKRVIKKVIDCAYQYDFSFKDLIKSPITGAKGNIEYLSYFIYNKEQDNKNIDMIIEKVVTDESSTDS